MFTLKAIASVHIHAESVTLCSLSGQLSALSCQLSPKPRGHTLDNFCRDNGPHLRCGRKPKLQILAGSALC